jgi:hypothetical protein
MFCINLIFLITICLVNGITGMIKCHMTTSGHLNKISLHIFLSLQTSILLHNLLKTTIIYSTVKWKNSFSSLVPGLFHITYYTPCSYVSLMTKCSYVKQYSIVYTTITNLSPHHPVAVGWLQISLMVNTASLNTRVQVKSITIVTGQRGVRYMYCLSHSDQNLMLFL